MAFLRGEYTIGHIFIYLRPSPPPRGKPGLFPCQKMRSFINIFNYEQRGASWKKNFYRGRINLALGRSTCRFSSAYIFTEHKYRLDTPLRAICYRSLNIFHNQFNTVVVQQQSQSVHRCFVVSLVRCNSDRSLITAAIFLSSHYGQ